MLNNFIEDIKKLNIDINEDHLKKLEIYYNYLIEYNSHTNITRIISKEDVYYKHFYDSLLVTKIINLNEINNLIDIGTGAGFPGIVLKIFFPNLKITLLDSNNKKTTFLNNLINKLNLNNIEVINDRAENYAINHLNEYDICISRSVAFIDIIIELSKPFIKEDGYIILMKGNIENEIKVLEKYQNDLEIKEYNILNYIYKDNERNLIKISKKNKTIKVLSYNQIIKKNKKIINNL